MHDEIVQWACFLKGHVTKRRDIWNIVRSHFGLFMYPEWPGPVWGEIDNWGHRLGIEVRHGTIAPSDMPKQGVLVQFTWVRFKLHLPEGAAFQFSKWFSDRLYGRGYATGIYEALGLRDAMPAGKPWVIRMPSILGDDENPDLHTWMENHENANLVITFQEYKEWESFSWTRRPSNAMGDNGAFNVV